MLLTTKSSEQQAVYNVQLECWLTPYIDAYELSTVQKAYDELTHSNFRLSPTHYALRIIPGNEEVAYKLLSDTTMWVSTIPFGYMPMVGENPLPTVKKPSTREIKQIDDYCGDDSIDKETSVIFQPLYVRWPVDKELPSNVTSEKLYDVYTPVPGSQIDSLISAGLSSVIQNRGERPDAGYHYPWQPRWNLKIKTYDEVLGVYSEMKKIRVKFMDYYTFYTGISHTDNAGKVEVPEDAPMTSIASLEFYTADFIITDNNNITQVSQSLGSLDYLADLPYIMNGLMPITTIELGYDFKRQVYQAAWYYYYGHNDLLDNIDKMQLDTPFRIATYADSTSLTYNGVDGIAWFFATQTNPHVEIANYEPIDVDYRSSCLFCAVLHELGHASHYMEMGYNSYSLVHNRIKESFASFMGWYNARNYYSSIVSTDFDVNVITKQGRQQWDGSSSNNYTPIFIDLVDDYNQSLSDPSLVIDNISGVGVGDVLSFAIGPHVWFESAGLMLLKVGNLYSLSDFSNLISKY